MSVCVRVCVADVKLIGGVYNCQVCVCSSGYSDRCGYSNAQMSEFIFASLFNR